MEGENKPLLASGSSQKKKVHFYNNVGDFINILKAFIGTNYQALPFAFHNSGVAFGLVGVLIIATLTDHCIQQLIKCKGYIIDNLCEEQRKHRHIPEEEEEALRLRLARDIGYGDIGRLTFGPWCYHLIQAAVWFTQYMTCISYLIFIGNAVFEMYPMVPAIIPLHNATNYVKAEPSVPSLKSAIGVPMLNYYSLDHVHSRSLRDISPSIEYAMSPVSGAAYDYYFDSYSNMSTFAPIIDNNTSPATMEPANMTVATTTVPTTTSHPNKTTTPRPTVPLVMVTTAPSLKYIVLFPVAFFILTSLLRNLRSISLFSGIAAAALSIGAGAVFIYLLVDFHVGHDFVWYKVLALPLFIGQLTSAYEGIGCLIPIESSMEGNRHMFPYFLHACVYLVCIILSAFGLIGYLRYGENVQQLIVLSIPQHSILSIFIDVTLIISVLFTYPLQCYPVIDIFESYLFAPGKLCGPRSSGRLEYDEINEEPSIQISGSGHYVQRQDSFDESQSEVAVVIPDKVPSWKRNVLRLLITLSIAGFAIVLRDNFAYLNSFVGAVGCSLLAFILPCMMHLKLKMNELPNITIVKDIVIICVSIFASILTLAIIAQKVVTGQIHE